MARKLQTDALKQVARIRELQRLGAEVRAGRAAVAQRAKHKVLHESEHLRASVEESWRASLETMTPEITTLWSTDLLRQEDAVCHAQREALRADEDLLRRTQDSLAASKRNDIANSMAHRAERHDLQQRDDAALQDVLDRHVTQRGER